MLSPKPDQDPLASPTMSLPSPKGTRAVSHSPQPDRDSLASPTMSLPSPQGSKAVTTSPVQGSQRHQAVLMSPSAVGCATADGFQSPLAVRKTRPVTHGQNALDLERESNAETVEVYVLSEIWKVFEQVVKQVRSWHGCPVLLACHPSSCSPEPVRCLANPSPKSNPNA